MTERTQALLYVKLHSTSGTSIVDREGIPVLFSHSSMGRIDVQ